MKTIMPFAMTVLLALSAGKIVMADQIPMTAEYMLFSSTSIGDPAPDAKKDSVGIYISGEAARKIYDAMDVPAKKGGCDGEMMYKEAGDFICYLTDTAYCEIGIILKTGKTTTASIC